jgi:hypothetical protein
MKRFSTEILHSNFPLVSRNGVGWSIVGDLALSGLQDVCRPKFDPFELFLWLSSGLKTLRKSRPSRSTQEQWEMRA